MNVTPRTSALAALILMIGVAAGSLHARIRITRADADPRGLIIRTVETQRDGTTFRHQAVWSLEHGAEQPGVLMVPNWMGPTEESLHKAAEIASEGYVVLMADIYGVEVRPKNSQEAGQAAGKVRSDRRGLMRPRAQMALDALRNLEEAPLDTENVAAIGFCFGGGTVLELGRAGADLDVIVSFHGDLASPTLGDAAA
ncbi:MAG: dienelactone hydrolase family protein, partial [Opitutales bacterium]